MIPLSLLALAIDLAAAWTTIEFVRAQASWSLEERRQLRRSLSGGERILFAILLLAGVGIMVSGFVLPIHGPVAIDLFAIALGVVALVIARYLTKLFSRRPPISRG